MGAGAVSYLQFGREATYKTPVACTHRLGFVSESVKPNFAVIEDPTLTGGLVASTINTIGEQALGPLKFVVDYEGLDMLWDLAFGTNTFGSKGGTDAGANPYTHTYTEKSYLNSYTFELIEGDVPTGKCQRLVGAKCRGMTWAVEAAASEAGLFQVTLDLVGAYKEENVTPTASLTAPTRVPAYFSHVSVFTDGSGDAAGITIPTSLEISLINAISENKPFMLGSSTRREPVRNGKVTSTLKFVRDFTSISHLTKLRAGTSVAPVIRFSDGGTRYMEFTMGTAKVVDHESPVDGPDIIDSTVTIQAINTAGSPDYGMKLVTQNSKQFITTP